VDLVSDKLPALQAYQLSIPAPRPAAGSFDATAAVRGQALFAGKAQCATCHTGPKFTDGPNLHPKADSIPEPETPSAADRSATGKYRTTPLRALLLHAPYFHDGSSPTLADVVARYNAERALGLTAAEMADLTEYLKSL
jgi:cytochrome c peroxidase